ncbi:MAG: protein kinase, partial [Muribaculaceae bacterium]|nr:protein kinase [Muribaculaceae bacterium]
MSENSATEKWTEITILPEWEEEYYNVYTARKFGKWVMLKTLKPEYKNEPQYQEMLDKEFEVRYNLAHSHIVMINDLEDVPGLGRCIITDDVYGDSLRKLINENRVTPEIIDKLRRQLVEAIEYIQANHIVHH